MRTDVALLGALCIAACGAPAGDDGPGATDVGTPIVAVDSGAPRVKDADVAGAGVDTGPGDVAAPEVRAPAEVVEAPDLGAPEVDEPAPGSWAAPIEIGALPFVHSADTSLAPPGVADAYSPCAPQTDESGPEVVYRLELAEAATIVVGVDDAPGDAVDVDVHLLTAADPGACVARDNVRFSYPLAAGTAWIVVDTWVDAALLVKAGPYTLTVQLAPPPGGGCTGAGSTCQDGEAPLVNPAPTEPPGLGGCPPGMGKVEGFCIDRYEATLAVMGGSGAEPWSPYATPSPGLAIVAVSAPGMVPQGHVSQLQADAACQAAGKRLCTDAEWLRACRGPQSTTYPYGDQLQPGVCNDARECHPVVEYFGTSADWIWSKLDHPCINQLPESLATTGALSGCQTAEGIYDMMGNLHEWTADPNGTFRGGFYVDTKINGPGCLYATTAHNVYHWDYSTGFRCCADL